MTQEDLKKFDKKLRTIKDPLGTGLMQLRKIIHEAADQYGLPESELMQIHSLWRANHN